MDFCRNRNIAVSGGLPSEYHQPEQLLSPSCSNPGTLDDLFSTHNTTEGDVSLEWLSIFVEDCFSSSGNCISVPPVAVPAGMGNELHKITPNNNGINYTASTNAMPLQLETKAPIKQQQNASSLHKFVIPGKARSKRKRGPLLLTKPKSQTQFTSWRSHHRIIEGNPFDNVSLSCSSDPPLLQQAYWFADSELILPITKKEDEDEDEDDDIYNRSNSNGRLKATERRGDDEGEGEGEGEVEEDDQEGKEEDEEEVVGKKNMSSNGQQQQGRRCSHCLAQRTPQWRAGPMGPKTLCNACGVRYKSGRLLPEYRPAKSPTFVSYKHSNSHKKVMEMRMALPSSPPS